MARGVGGLGIVGAEAGVLRWRARRPCSASRRVAPALVLVVGSSGAGMVSSRFWRTGLPQRRRLVSGVAVAACSRARLAREPTCRSICTWRCVQFSAAPACSQLKLPKGHAVDREADVEQRMQIQRQQVVVEEAHRGRVMARVRGDHAALLPASRSRGRSRRCRCRCADDARSSRRSYMAMQRSARPSAVSTNTQTPQRVQPIMSATVRVSCRRTGRGRSPPRSRRPQISWMIRPSDMAGFCADGFCAGPCKFLQGPREQSQRGAAPSRTRRPRRTAHSGWRALQTVAAVQDQPVVRIDAVALGNAREQPGLDFQLVAPRRQAGAVGNAEDMGVDRHRRLAERDVEHHVGGLAADARQSLQGLARARHLAAVALDQQSAGLVQVLRLVAVQADAADRLGQRGRPSASIFCGVLARGNRRRVALLTPASVACAESSGGQQLEHVAVLELAGRLRVGALQRGEEGLDVAGLRARVGGVVGGVRVPRASAAAITARRSSTRIGVPAVRTQVGELGFGLGGQACVVVARACSGGRREGIALRARRRPARRSQAAQCACRSR